MTFADFAVTCEWTEEPFGKISSFTQACYSVDFANVWS